MTQAQAAEAKDFLHSEINSQGTLELRLYRPIEEQEADAKIEQILYTLERSWQCPNKRVSRVVMNLFDSGVPDLDSANMLIRNVTKFAVDRALPVSWQVPTASKIHLQLRRHRDTTQIFAG